MNAVTNMAPSPSDLLSDRLLRLPQVIEIAGLSKAMIYRLVREGRFPQPCKPGGIATRWSEREVSFWKEQVLAARSDQFLPQR